MCTRGGAEGLSCLEETGGLGVGWDRFTLRLGHEMRDLGSGSEWR